MIDPTESYATINTQKKAHIAHGVYAIPAIRNDEFNVSIEYANGGVFDMTYYPINDVSWRFSAGTQPTYPDVVGTQQNPITQPVIKMHVANIGIRVRISFFTTTSLFGSIYTEFFHMKLQYLTENDVQNYSRDFRNDFTDTTVTNLLLYTDELSQGKTLQAGYYYVVQRHQDFPFDEILHYDGINLLYIKQQYKFQRENNSIQNVQTGDGTGIIGTNGQEITYSKMVNNYLIVTTGNKISVLEYSPLTSTLTQINVINKRNLPVNLIGENAYYCKITGTNIGIYKYTIPTNQEELVFENPTNSNITEILEIDSVPYYVLNGTHLYNVENGKSIQLFDHNRRVNSYNNNIFISSFVLRLETVQYYNFSTYFQEINLYTDNVFTLALWQLTFSKSQTDTEFKLNQLQIACDESVVNSFLFGKDYCYVQVMFRNTQSAETYEIKTKTKLSIDNPTLLISDLTASDVILGDYNQIEIKYFVGKAKKGVQIGTMLIDYDPAAIPANQPNTAQNIAFVNDVFDQTTLNNTSGVVVQYQFVNPTGGIRTGKLVFDKKRRNLHTNIIIPVSFENNRLSFYHSKMLV